MGKGPEVPSMVPAVSAAAEDAIVPTRVEGESLIEGTIVSTGVVVDD